MSVTNGEITQNKVKIPQYPHKSVRKKEKNSATDF